MTNSHGEDDSRSWASTGREICVHPKSAVATYSATKINGHGLSQKIVATIAKRHGIFSRITDALASSTQLFLDRM